MRQTCGYRPGLTYFIWDRKQQPVYAEAQFEPHPYWCLCPAIKAILIHDVSMDKNELK